VDLSDVVKMWPISVLALVVGSVVLAFLNCAVAEVVMRLAAWIFTPDPGTRAVHVEAWRRMLEDATPRERPAHAASFLWIAVCHLPARRHYRQSPAPGSSDDQRRSIRRRDLIWQAVAVFNVVFVLWTVSTPA
jgi:hypothetical protein